MPPPNRSEKAGQSSKGKLRILIAEDIRAIAMRLAHVFQSRGYEVESTADGEECLRALERRLPDLLFLDLMLPRLNGMDVLKRIRTNPAMKDLKVVVCTSKDFSTDVRSLMDLGVDEVIIKPFDNETVLQKVDACFAGQQTGEVSKASVSSTQSDIGYAPELNLERPRIRFWGTRGSIPVSGVQYLRHGGNTSCIEYACGKDQILFDAGSGLREASNALLAGGPRHIHLFLTHTHWDHINGFPFFTPMFIPGYEITVYGERGFGKNFETLLNGQLDRDYFPAERQDLRAKMNFQILDENPVNINGIKVTRAFTNHPGATVGFKVEHLGKKIAYVPDNEFLKGYKGHPKEVVRSSDLVVPQEPLVSFLSGVDVLIHEAQYLALEYSKKVGWGHSSLSNACVLAKLAKVKKWIVIHHDPAHADVYLEDKLHLTRQILEEIECPIPVCHAYDGMVEFL